jgi:adenosylcobinamide kinase/adenosylcobinamide-phosphate guanylyltransferase
MFMKMLVLGGCRSGKSAYAEMVAAKKYQRKYFVATLERSDDPEMQHRITLHQNTRRDDWETIEEPLDIVDVLKVQQHQADVFVVDCITMWITNMVCKGMGDDAIEDEVHRLADVLSDVRADVLFVANEVGLGIVPESSLGRRFRDLAGWTNQQLAKVCDDVVFMAAGLPLYLKKS